MHVGLFGGSFNPPHLAHQVIAETVREQFGLDQVWWVLARVPPHKEGEALAPAHHRLALTQHAVAGNPGFAVCRLELDRPPPSYTVDTLRHLQAAHPEHTFALIIGGDSLHGFASWRSPEEIVARVPLLVYRRPGDPAEPPPVAARVQFATAPLLEVSGTDIRARCRAGRSIRYLVPDAVRTYIAAHGLYAG